MDSWGCRACRATIGELVLDLGEQPACDYFPAGDDPGPDPVHPLQMWLCGGCGLAQLVDDPGSAEEPKAQEPAALVHQAEDAVGRVAAAGYLAPGRRLLEYGSPHGGSWVPLLTRAGLTAVADGGPADVIIDCFGIMHASDQAAAVAERAARLAPGGVLLLQYHSLRTIMRSGQWNALRHGHFAYYSATALQNMLAGHRLVLRRAWTFDLYGGTILLAVTAGDPTAGDPADCDESVRSILADEANAGVTDPSTVRELQRDAERRAGALHAWLRSERDQGHRVIGYGAASRAIALLLRAGVDRSLLPAVVDASPAKQGLRMPGTDIPVIGPERLRSAPPDSVALFLPDLLSEVRATLPEVEAAGGRWCDVEALALQGG